MHFLANPSTFMINELTFAITSNDVLFDLSRSGVWTRERETQRERERERERERDRERERQRQTETRTHTHAHTIHTPLFSIFIEASNMHSDRMQRLVNHLFEQRRYVCVVVLCFLLAFVLVLVNAPALCCFDPFASLFWFFLFQLLPAGPTQ